MKKRGPGRPPIGHEGHPRSARGCPHCRARKLREALGLTQGGLAQWLHKDLRTIQRWERGELSPDPVVLELMTRAGFGVEIIDDRGDEDGLRAKTTIHQEVRKRGMVMPEVKLAYVQGSRGLEIVGDAWARPSLDALPKRITPIVREVLSGLGLLAR